MLFKKKTNKKGIALTAPAALLLFSLTILPLVLLIIFSFMKGNLGAHGIETYTFDNFIKIFSTITFYKLMLKSLGIGLIVTIACILIAWPAAWGLAKVVNPKYQNLLVMIVIIPFFTSQLLLIYSVMNLLQAKGLIMSFLGFIGIADPSNSIIYTNIAVIFILIYEYLPYMILCLYANMERIDNNLILASRSLGAGKMKTIFNVVFPLSIPGLIAGTLLVLVPVTGSFVEPAIAGGPNGMMIGSLIDSQFSVVLNMGFGAALSMSFLLITSMVLLFINLFANKANKVIGGEQS